MTVKIFEDLYKVENSQWKFIVKLSRTVLGNMLPNAKVKKLTAEQRSVLKNRTKDVSTKDGPMKGRYVFYKFGALG